MKKIEVLGIFDSGLGGYSVYNALKGALPDLSMVLYADQENAPYGNYDYETILSLSIEAMRWFEKENINDVLLACNTASIVIDDLRIAFPNMRIWGIIDLTLSQIPEEKERVGLVGTTATIHSNAYNQRFNKPIFSVSIPELAGAIEQLEAHDIVYDMIAAALPELNHIDCLILGCTHYPLVKDVFESIFDVPIFDSIEPILKFISENYKPTKGSRRIVTTADSGYLKHQINILFDEIETVEDVT